MLTQTVMFVVFMLDETISQGHQIVDERQERSYVLTLGYGFIFESATVTMRIGNSSSGTGKPHE